MRRLRNVILPPALFNRSPRGVLSVRAPQDAETVGEIHGRNFVEMLRGESPLSAGKVQQKPQTLACNLGCRFPGRRGFSYKNQELDADFGASPGQQSKISD